MTLDSDVALIESEMLEVRSIFLAIVKLLKAFNITDPQLLPYGLKPHTRSVSWIVEQVITQQTKFHAAQLGLTDVDINVPDTCLHDCILLGVTQLNQKRARSKRVVVREHAYFVRVSDMKLSTA